MDIEDIAKLDLFLRQKNGTQNLLDIEALIIADDNPQAVNKLKEAATRLNKIELDGLENVKETWKNLFTHQVRFSVNRAKEKVKK